MEDMEIMEILITDVAHLPLIFFQRRDSKDREDAEKDKRAFECKNFNTSIRISSNLNKFSRENLFKRHRFFS